VLKLKLAQLPDSVRGIYGPNKSLMPARARYLHPEAARSYMQMHDEAHIVCSDVFRSAEASLAAIQVKTGVQPPGFSGHNYGFSVDVAVDQMLKERSWTYTQLRDYMSSHHWVGHRRDGKRGSEDWHFNYLGASRNAALSRVEDQIPGTWSRAVEHMILLNYDGAFRMSAEDTQSALKKLGMYKGAIDGELGQLSRAAALAFARAWKLHENTVYTLRFFRTLAYVAADIVIVAA